MKNLILLSFLFVIVSCNNVSSNNPVNDSITVTGHVNNAISSNPKVECPIKLSNPKVKPWNNITNAILITLKNRSNKPIDGIKITMECYDNFGGLVTKIDGIYQKTLPAKKSAIQMWESPNELVTKCKAFVYLVHFKDGTFWKL